MGLFSVYVHTNKANGKKYFGMTNQIKNRWRCNGIAYKPDKGKNDRPFCNAIVKYGWDGFEHVIVRDGLSFEEACILEKQLIEKHKTRVKKHGYNVAEGGNGGRIYLDHPKGMKGKSHTESKKQKQSDFMKSNNPMNHIKWGETHNHPRGMQGRKHAEEDKKRISETVKAKKINCKPVKLTEPNGNVILFDRVQDASNYLGLIDSSSIIQRCLKTKEPYKIRAKNKFTPNAQKFVGMKLEYIDNTEVTNLSNAD